MPKKATLFSLAALIPSLAIAPFAYAATPTIGPSDAVQVGYAANLNFGESYINITNAGTVGGLDPSGNVCVNVYAFDPAEEMISCCSCLTTPDGLYNLGVNRDITVNTLTGVIPNSVTVKLVASTPSHSGTSCSNSAEMLSTRNLVSGMRASGTTLHATPVAGSYATTEIPFYQTTPSASELSKLTSLCGSIIENGSGFGICRTCRTGGE
ncbi:MAG TPA: hypothetical protein VMB26_16590 [Candidatus Binataceae bacterium]|nr:hypothetical protein [Candidatus Binataceae bacterium]